MVPELMVKNGPFRFQFHNTTGSPKRAKSPHKRATGGMRRCMFRARSSDLSVVKEPWNLSNAQTSAPISNNEGLVKKTVCYKCSPETRKIRKWLTFRRFGRT